MPYDDRVAAALAAVEAPRRAFIDAVRTAATEVEGRRRAAGGSTDDSAGRVAEELGAFASGRVNAERLAAFLPETPALHPAAAEALRRAGAVLDEIAALEPEDFVVEVTEGRSLAEQVQDRLAFLGRAFGAAELVEATRNGRPSTVDADRRLDRYPADRWTVRERELAPPLVVVAPGSTLRVGFLGDLLEPHQKIALVIDGAAPPAPLAPLVGPGVWVGQIGDVAEFEAFAAHEGVGVCALMPEGAARWVHDPSVGLTVHADVDPADVRALGNLSVWKQRADLEALRAQASGVTPQAAPVPDALASESSPADVRPAATAVEQPAAPTDAEPSTAEPEPVDRLAAWLIAQADLAGT